MSSKVKNAKKNGKNPAPAKEYESDEENYMDDVDLEKIYKDYTGDKNDLRKTQDYLENCFQSGNAICLICIQTVKRKDSIWCCSNCYCFYHLLCIQKWANDSLFQKKQYAENQPSGYYNNLGEFVTKKKIEIVWDCPQCRTTFLPSEIPRHYECFCKKSINPPDHLWQLPHSCGEFCEKKLGSCGHQCNLYCHPGACPPCPQMIRKSCKCGKSPAKLIRCSKQEWTCDRVCLKKLGCEIHSCQEICHDSCKPCTKSSKRKCLCGASTKEIRCSEGSWNCPKKCGKPFACGLHSCERKCHSPSDTCGNCPFSFKSCGCGKTEGFQDCTKDQLDSCGDTCQKPLNCGVHQCLERCHKGACPSCLELIEKSCKCGKIKKEILCSKPLICETKCKNMRACRKHPCSRKCCDGNCPPCDKICGKFLSCGKHKCNALCHDGACYPCPLKVQLKCSCGGTSISVICGREKKTKLPKCRLPCKIPSKCHHTNPHRCHEGVCSRCVQICNLPNDISRCGHLCQAQCHDYVKVVTKDKNFVPAGPWDVPVEKVEWKRIDHPLCEVPVEVTCIGGHETSPLPCHSAKSLSCGRKCQRKLNCGNHVCQLECHSVVDRDSDLQDENCQDCQEVCTAKRPPGCLHLCSKNYCHPAPCKKCIVQLKSKCFCGLTDVYYRCCDLNKNGLGEEEKKKIMEKMFSCGNRCIKNYPCNHRCTSNCHSGPCPDSESCKKKVKIFCKCKTRKFEINCDKIRRDNLEFIDCDEICEEKRQKEIQLKLEQKMEQERLEKEKNQRELEEFEKKFGRKKTRERKVREVEEKSDNKLMIIGASVSGLVVVLAFVLYFTIFTN